MTDRVFSERKTSYYQRFGELLDQYDQVLVVGADNVRSTQMHTIRKQLRGKGLLIMGKNVRSACSLLADGVPNAQADCDAQGDSREVQEQPKAGEPLEHREGERWLHLRGGWFVAGGGPLGVPEQQARCAC